ncbi:MAG: threonine-phosphate decarboxylase CobD [Methylocystis sp.]|jgi:cobalamin biosynthetic protein CobC
MTSVVTPLSPGPQPAAAEPIEHGGGLDAARRRFPQAPGPWIDLSTGVSPRAYPLPQIAPDAWTRLPDADALNAMEKAAAAAYRAPAGLAVVAGAGTQAFIQCLPRLFPARRVASFGFTYAEHLASWLAAGAQTSVAVTLDELAAVDVGIVVNPNNPDGRLTSPRQLIELAQRMAARGGMLIVDEAFIDFTPGASVAPMAGGNVVVLRSFGKAYGLPGLRLGFALCDASMARTLRAALGPWNVSGPALAVGAAALTDAAWLEESRAMLGDAACRLDCLLRAAGFGVIGGTSLFRLAAHDDAASWFERLGRSGILARRFPERPKWLRFGLPRAPHEWERLSAALGVD